ncbi:Beta-hexosaminidase [Pseudoalteromonas sp. P1-9]|uniref:beta-N-acetylhexosaminidase n=1 Tax=Pseudoalteromonas sp. P1-9 TaxID=1710354 RepID=UPI0006D64C1F|nr:beta-N-acetylhexosaminidase [Pseudoalteromonas sp. P1-9]KPV95219.1 Beta-hexosaminidase [Pseudoalteromonas sp. P1-9]
MSIHFINKACVFVKLCSLLLFSSSLFAETSLMPLPQSFERQTGELRLPSQIEFSFEGFSDQRKEFQAKRLELHLTRIAKHKVTLIDLANNKKQTPDNATLKVIVRDKESDLLVPQLNNDESYQLVINQNGITINANTVFGAQHGLTTLTQLAANHCDNQLILPHAIITDAPRFAWRGLLIDSARHFLSIETIKRQLNTMASAKLNVLHWHLTDDQGWRIESKRFPRLTDMASDGLFYKQSEVKDFVEYAALLGIRVVPEFGMPGHASAIAVAYPELMAEVKPYEMERHWGVFKPLLDISKPEVYQFVDSLIEEMTGIFPDQYLHIGGDEVEPEQWLNNKDIQALMAKHSLKNGHDLQNYFNTQIQPIIAKHQRIMMGWDEIFHQDLPKDIVVQSWRGHDSLNEVANSGHLGILSTGFYIDQPQYSDYHYRNDPLRKLPQVDLSKSLLLAKSFVIDRLKGSDVKGELVVLGEQVLIKLNNNHHQLALVNKAPNQSTNAFKAKMDSWMGPLTFEFDLKGETSAVMIGNSRYPIKLSTLNVPSEISLSRPLKNKNAANILGAEATIWSEMVTDDNIDLRIWPRLYVISERLWSTKHINDANDMYQRLRFINTYAAEVIGAAHLAQQKAGFNALLPKSFDKYKKAHTLALLNVMAELLEPAHYYTRHHIKYLNDEYHQEAPLNLFVDYLNVESEQVRQIKRWMLAYTAGDADSLTQLDKQLIKWQKGFEMGLETLSSSKKLSELKPTLISLSQFIGLSQQVISSCKGEIKGTGLDEQLLDLQKLTDELVIAGIYPMRDLYLACTEQ